MTLNFMIKITNVARRGFSVKLVHRTPGKNRPVQLKSVVPNVAVGGGGTGKRTGFCHFHVTSPRNAVPPLYLFALRLVGKAGAIISGRMIRMWWKRLTPEEREIVLAKLRSKSSKIAFAGTVFVGFAFLYYLEHIVEEPITRRKRFIIFNEKHIRQIGEFEYRNQLERYKANIVPTWHPVYRRVARVATHLLSSNLDFKEIRDKEWSVTVIDKPDITNAFALPHGKIFVYTGMLNVCTNDDQLAIVLAHEISHTMLCHVAEIMSNVYLIDFILLIPSLVFWAIFPDVWAIFSEWITSRLADIFIKLPYSRAIEKEADIVGMQLAAKSCYDVREAPVIWQKIGVVSGDFPVEWLSTHPSHQTRQFDLQDLVPQALVIRDQSKCPPLDARVRRLWA